jgi:hypothetical protein
LAPASHNTQCWKFALDNDAITILPDLTRRCPAVDPDDHHLFVSLGCAAENLIQAARAHGLRGEAAFDEARSAVRIALSPAAAEVTDLFNAIASRQSTRAEYDGKPLASDDLRRLEAAARSDRVRLLLLTDRPALDRVLEFVVQGNTAQMQTPLSSTNSRPGSASTAATRCAWATACSASPRATRRCRPGWAA